MCSDARVAGVDAVAETRTRSSAFNGANTHIATTAAPAFRNPSVRPQHGLAPGVTRKQRNICRHAYRSSLANAGLARAAGVAGTKEDTGIEPDSRRVRPLTSAYLVPGLPRPSGSAFARRAIDATGVPMFTVKPTSGSPPEFCLRCHGSLRCWQAPAD